MIQSLRIRCPWLNQFFKFGIVGVSNTVISYLTYASIVWGFSLASQIGLQFANLIAFIVSVLNAYFWNTRWVFKKELKSQNAPHQRRQSMTKFFISYGGTFLLSVCLLYFWTSILHINKFVAPIITLLITVPSNFLINKFWSFRVRKC